MAENGAANLLERLYGHYPPQGENDIGDIGHLRKDVAEIKKDSQARKALPEKIYKYLIYVVAAKAVIDIIFPGGFNLRSAANVILVWFGGQ